MYLIDTSIWIAALRRGCPPKVAEQVRAWVIDNEAATMPVIRIELSAGCRSDEEFSGLDDTLAGLINIQLQEEHYQKAASTAFQLRKKGITAGIADLLIAVAAAGEPDCTLIHADSGFEPIAKALSLPAENWKSRLQEKKSK